MWPSCTPLMRATEAALFSFLSLESFTFLDNRCLLIVSTLPRGHWICRSLPRQAVDWHHAVCWSVARGIYAACNLPVTWSTSLLFAFHSNSVAGNKTSFTHASYMLVALFYNTFLFCFISFMRPQISFEFQIVGVNEVCEICDMTLQWSASNVSAWNEGLELHWMHITVSVEYYWHSLGNRENHHIHTMRKHGSWHPEFTSLYLRILCNSKCRTPGRV